MLLRRAGRCNAGGFLSVPAVAAPDRAFLWTFLAMRPARERVAASSRQRHAPCDRFTPLPVKEIAMKKLVLETTAPFQGLPELVADKEGLFAKEGLTIEWVERESEDKSTRVDVNSPKGLDPFASHGKMLEQGKADLYNACE